MVSVIYDNIDSDPACYDSGYKLAGYFLQCLKKKALMCYHKLYNLWCYRLLRGQTILVSTENCFYLWRWSTSIIYRFHRFWAKLIADDNPKRLECYCKSFIDCLYTTGVAHSTLSRPKTSIVRNIVFQWQR